MSIISILFFVNKSLLKDTNAFVFMLILTTNSEKKVQFKEILI